MSIECVHYRTAEAECGVCYPCTVTSLRAEVERLRAKGEALAKATKRVTHEWSMDANVRVIGAAVIDARAALAEWEKP